MVNHLDGCEWVIFGNREVDTDPDYHCPEGKQRLKVTLFGVEFEYGNDDLCLGDDDKENYTFKFCPGCGVKL